MDFTKVPQGQHTSTLDFSKASSDTSIMFSKSISNISVEMYWESDTDGDLIVALLSNGKMLPGSINPNVPRALRGCLYYGSPVLPGITHSGDIRGEVDGDPSTPEETCVIALGALDPAVDELVVIISTHSEDAPITLETLRDCRTLVINSDTNEVLAGAETEGETATSMEVCRLIRTGDEWNFKRTNVAIGSQAAAMADVYAKFN